MERAAGLGGSPKRTDRSLAAARAGSILATSMLAAALLLLEAPLASRAFAQDDEDDLAEERTVDDVEIHGNQAFGDGTLKDVLRTKGSGGFPFFRKRPLRADYIRFDRAAIQDYYRRHGYLEARVDSVPVRLKDGGRKADVAFHVTEGPLARVETVTILGAGPVPEERLRRELELRPGQPFDVSKQDLSRQAVEGQYLEEGYVAVQVRDSLEVQGTRVRIVYRIDPGPRSVLGGIQVEGTGATKPEFVTREVVLRRGEVLRRSKLVRSQQRIYDSGFYSDVQLDRGPIDTLTNATDLIVTVRERKMGWLDVGIGYGTIDQLRLTAQVGQRNLWRDGVRLVATGLLGIRIVDEPWRARLGNRRLDAAITRPWIAGARVSTTIGGFAEEIPDTLLPTDDKPYRAYGGSVGLTRDFSLDTSGRLFYENRRVLRDSATFIPTTGVARKRYTVSRLVTSLERDTRDNVFDPRRGFDLLGTAEYAGGALLGTARFFKTTGTASAYRAAGRATTLAFRIRGGVINPQAAPAEPSVVDTLGAVPPLEFIPTEDRFRLGGATSVRGYEENEIGTRLTVPLARDPRKFDPEPEEARGGRYLLLVNAELRRQLVGRFGATVFFDGGNVWVRRTDMKLRKILSFADGAGYNDMRYSAGAGLRFETPIGPLRFDYGWKIRMARWDQPDLGRGAFHFSVGQTF